MSNIVAKFADRYAVDANKVMQTLAATAFKQRDGSVPSMEQMTALMVVADQYGLNPFTREIYAFPDKANGIVPVVGVDGWTRIINSHPQLNGIEFNYSPEMVTPEGATSTCHEWVECVIYRKDRDRPIVVREYLDEVYRKPFDNKAKGYAVAGPWQTHAKRFLRHKALIQASRLAFGFAGIYDQDEADRINEQRERDMGAAQVVEPVQPPALPEYSDDSFEVNFPKWEVAIKAGRKTADAVINTVSTRATLTDKQIAAIRNVTADDDAPF